MLFGLAAFVYLVFALVVYRRATNVVDASAANAFGRALAPLVVAIVVRGLCRLALALVSRPVRLGLGAGARGGLSRSSVLSRHRRSHSTLRRRRARWSIPLASRGRETRRVGLSGAVASLVFVVPRVTRLGAVTSE